MQSFDIIKKSDLKNTYRVKTIKDTYDLQIDQTQERFVGSINLDKDWKVGLIVGNSGTGKSTIAKEIFGDFFVPDYKSKSVIDDFNVDLNLKQIIDTLNSVGFSSIPNYLKPYNVLSNGEKMRVDLARAILSESETIVFDEFTSVVDRNIAQIMSFNVQKNIRKSNKKFVAVSCHFDIEEWLQPDWVFNTNDMTFHFCEEQKKNRPARELCIFEITKNKEYYWNIFKKYHYLSHSFNKASRVFVATYAGQLCAFSACLYFPNSRGNRKYYKDHRTVVLPDFQGLNIGLTITNFIADLLHKNGFSYFCVTSNPARIIQLKKSNNFKCTRFGRMHKSKTNMFAKSISNNKITASFLYIHNKN